MIFSAITFIVIAFLKPTTYLEYFYIFRNKSQQIPHRMKRISPPLFVLFWTGYSTWVLRPLIKTSRLLYTRISITLLGKNKLWQKEIICIISVSLFVSVVPHLPFYLASLHINIERQLSIGVLGSHNGEAG